VRGQSQNPGAGSLGAEAWTSPECPGDRHAHAQDSCPSRPFNCPRWTSAEQCVLVFVRVRVLFRISASQQAWSTESSERIQRSSESKRASKSDDERRLVSRPTTTTQHVGPPAVRGGVSVTRDDAYAAEESAGVDVDVRLAGGEEENHHHHQREDCQCSCQEVFGVAKHYRRQRHDEAGGLQDCGCEKGIEWRQGRSFTPRPLASPPRASSLSSKREHAPTPTLAT
jgi:hypothetical protein